MKLLFCRECRDIVGLSPKETRQCHCGRSFGAYTGTRDVEVGGPCQVLGLLNEDLLVAEPGKDYRWFVIGEPNEKIKRRR